MADNIKNILTNLSTDVDQQKLLEYLNGQLSQTQKHDLEKELIDNEFESDALEGLADIKDKKNIGHLVELLNRDLQKKTARKKSRRKKLELKDQSWLYISILIIILLIVMAYFVIHRLNNSGAQP